jgi:anti-sigma factor RsiW
MSRTRSTETGLTCHEVVELITDYLEDALPATERARVEEHLAGCEGCTHYLAQMRETIRLTGMLTEEQIPEEQKAELLDAFLGWAGPSPSAG